MTTQSTITRATLGVLALGVLALALLTHGGLLQAGLPLGDYALLRPFTQHETLQVLTGPWAPPESGLGAYYRPLAAMLYGGLFDLLGVHASWLHAIVLLELAALAWLAAILVARDSAPRTGLLVAAVLIFYPRLPATVTHTAGAIGQLTAMVLTLLCLLRWQTVRHDQRLLRWWPIFAMIGLGAFLREDMVMLAPALLALQWITAVRDRNAPRPNIAVVAGAVAALVGVAAIRLAAYPHLTATAAGVPFATTAPQAFVGLHRVFLFGHSAAGLVATTAALGLTVAGAWSVFQDRRNGLTQTFIMGAVLFVAASVPLAADPGSSDARLPLLLLAAALMVAAGAGLLAERLPEGAPRVAALVAIAVLFGWSQRVVAHDLITPCTAIAIPPVDGHVEDWMSAQARACASGLPQPISDVLPAMQWGAGPRRVLWLARDTTTVTFALTPPLNLESDVDVQVDVDGASHTAKLRPGTLTRLTYHLRPSPLLAVRGGHWLDLRVDTEFDIPVATDIQLTRGR